MVTVVLGRRGCGKTTTIRQKVSSKPRLLIFDTLAEYSSSGRVFRDILPFIDYVEKNQYGQFRAVYQPIDNSDLEQPFSDFLRVAWIVGDCTIVVDEVDQVSSAISVPDSLARNLRYGRHRKISIIAASRRAADVPRLITSQADELVSFNQTEPRDISYIEAFAGREFASRTATLPRYQALVYRPFDGVVSQRESDKPTETRVALRGVVGKKGGDPLVNKVNTEPETVDSPDEEADNEDAARA